MGSRGSRDRTVGREWGVRVERVLPAPPALVYGILSDTNRWNRITGVSPSSHTFELWDREDPTSRTRVGHARYMGIPVRFAEEGEYWNGATLRGERHFTGFVGRLFARGILNVDVEPLDGGAASRARIRVAVAIVGALGYLMAPLTLARMWLATRLYLRSVSRAVERAQRVLPEAERDSRDPAAAVARRALLAIGAGDNRVTGPSRRMSREAIKQRAARFAHAPVSGELRRRLIDFVGRQPDEALLQVRPFEVARAWGEDRREVLRTFLHATKAGLFDLEWQVNCPTCRVGTDAATGLAALASRVHCDECDISFDVDFAENVEATFSVNPAIRPVERTVYCASTPYVQPHIHGYVALAPGETRTLSPLPHGDVLLRARGTPRQVVVRRGREPVEARVGVDAIETAGEPAGEPGSLRVANDTDREVRLVVERAGWDSEIARGSLLLRLPDFIELFGTDAPATGHRLSVGTFAILFTDVVGSTELYERLGDARAFSLIQGHWRDAGAIVERWGGAIVKTMGDGLMCCFGSTGDAVSAALAMIDATAELSRREEVRFAVRIGINEGPCYAVQTNGRLDLFGSTVNIAARLMDAASGRQVALLARMLAHPALHERLSAEHAVQQRVKTEMRGITGRHDVVLLCRQGAETMATGEHAPVVSAR